MNVICVHTNNVNFVCVGLIDSECRLYKFLLYIFLEKEKKSIKSHDKKRTCVISNKSNVNLKKCMWDLFVVWADLHWNWIENSCIVNRNRVHYFIQPNKLVIRLLMPLLRLPISDVSAGAGCCAGRYIWCCAWIGR